ncbi:MAG: hypothetical protein HN909_00555 [Phycisphaerales bacterium]|jgi:ribonuclease Z|nr:hypothetical protein [Phycisphaerales bacterium]MBT7170239.1 hypothetical protein [Phycisphaerales bacterium]
MESRPQTLSTVVTPETTILGYSVAGEETVILCPELDVVFDIGRCPREALAPDHLLLSHSHADHSAGLLYYFAQRDFQGIGGGTCVLPANLVERAEELVHAWGRFEGHLPPYHFVGIRDGEDYEIRRGLIARAFKVRHNRGAVGYSVIDVRQKLKDEYLGLGQDDIIALKKDDVEITRRVEIPLVAYLGDTAAMNFSDLPHVRDAKTLLIECTFVDEEHTIRAKAGKHIYIEQLPEILEGMNNERVLITHITKRSNLGFARRRLKKLLAPELYERVSFLMSRQYMPPKSADNE